MLGSAGAVPRAALLASRDQWTLGTWKCTRRHTPEARVLLLLCRMYVMWETSGFSLEKFPV